MALVKNSSMIGRDQQMDDSFSYVQSFVYDWLVSHPIVDPDQSELKKRHNYWKPIYTWKNGYKNKAYLLSLEPNFRLFPLNFLLNSLGFFRIFIFHILQSFCFLFRQFRTNSQWRFFLWNRHVNICIQNFTPNTPFSCSISKFMQKRHLFIFFP